jgi:hypothetical protein
MIAWPSGSRVRGWLILLLVLLPLPAFAEGVGTLAAQQTVGATDQGSSAGEDASTKTAGEGLRKVIKGNPGPWGEMEYHATFLQAPDSLIELLNVPSQTTIWRFPGLGKKAASDLLKSCNPGPELELSLLEDSLWDEDSPDGIRFFPPAKIIATLTVESRQNLYRELRRWKENSYHWSPLIIESGTVREWFAESGLREKLVSEIERTAYPIGDALAFSDLPYLIGWSETDEEDRQIMKMMTRTKTLMVRLRLGPESDLDSLRDYWSMGSLRNDAIPLLESLVLSQEEDLLDIAHLLPPLPRKLLYTFPSIGMGISGGYPDSLWTAANFLSYRPDSSSFGAAALLRTMEKHYDRVEDEYRFGDVLLLRRGDGKGALRAVVYIADGIVFTKSGRQMSRPWVLTKLDRVAASVKRQPEIEPIVEAWRRRPVPATN